MKRLLVAAVCLGLATTALAEKTRRIPRQAPTGGSPATVTINGNPLTIVVGNDTSMQVYNSNVPGTGQFYPPDCGVGETADSGVFLAAGTVFGPDFGNHPCGSASNIYVPWTPVSMTPVTGTGTAGDPFTVVIVVAAGGNPPMTETLTYVNGASTAYITLAFAAAPLLAPGGIAPSVLVGADLYLADNDDGFSLAGPTAAGGHAASASCGQLQYTISWLGTTPAVQWTANGYSTVWAEISAGSLDNSVDPTCIDNGAALAWAAGAGITISTGVSFAGQAVPVGAAVPTLSTIGLAALVTLLALVGYVLARKASPGA